MNQQVKNQWRLVELINLFSDKKGIGTGLKILSQWEDWSDEFTYIKRSVVLILSHITSVETESGKGKEYSQVKMNKSGSYV